MINDRALAAQQPNAETKDICGYENRLSMNEAQVDVHGSIHRLKVN